MAENLEFLTSVADVYGYNSSGDLLFTSKTLLNSSMEVVLGSSEVRGGRGNQLLYTYFHTGGLNLSLEETQFNLGFLAATLGQEIATGSNVYVEETITLGASGGGTVLGTPLAVEGATIYGWVTQLDGDIDKVTFTGSTFPSSTGTSGDEVCVRYYAANAAATSINIPANTIPKIVRLVLEAQLNANSTTSNKIGTLQIIIPKFSLSGAFNLSLSSDGTSNTPLSGMAYSFTDTETAACTSEKVYAKIVRILDNANWYDGVTSLSIEGGNFSLATTLGTKQLVVYAIRPGYAPFVAPVADLDFTSGTTGVATVTLHGGLVTGVSAGTSLISVSITAAPTVDTSATVTVPS